MTQKLWVHLHVYTPFRLGTSWTDYRYEVDGELFVIGGFELGVYEQPNGRWCVFETTSGGRMCSASTKEQALGEAAVNLSITPDFADQVRNMSHLMTLPVITAAEAHSKLKCDKPNEA